MLLPRHRLVGEVVKADELLGLVALEPGDAAFEHVGGQLHAVFLGDLQAVHHGGRGVRAGAFAVAGEPAPAAVGDLLALQGPHAGNGHVLDFFLIEDRIEAVAAAALADQLPALLDPLLVVADFLAVEVGAVLLDLLEVQLHGQQHLLRDHRRQEAIEGLLGAAVGIIDHVRQGIDHRPGQGRRIADLEHSLVDAPLGRHGNLHAGRGSILGAGRDDAR